MSPIELINMLFVVRFSRVWAWYYQTGSDFVKGKQAIEAFWQGAMDMRIKNAKLDSHHRLKYFLNWNQKELFTMKV